MLLTMHYTEYPKTHGRHLKDRFFVRKLVKNFLSIILLVAIPKQTF